MVQAPPSRRPRRRSSVRKARGAEPLTG